MAPAAAARRTGLSIAIALTLVLSGVAFATANADGGPMVRVSGPSLFAGCTSVSRQSSPFYSNAEVEPRVAVNPATIRSGRVNLVGVWQQDRYADGGARGIVAASSFDGGLTWHQTPLPFSRCVPGGLPLDRASDPWVSIGPDGTVFASAIGLRIAPSSVVLVGTVAAVSHDGGRTWSHAQIIAPEGADKDSILADPTQAGVAYAVWDVPPFGLMRFSTTIDGGMSWSMPLTVRALGRQGGDGHELLMDPRSHNLYDIFETAQPTKRTCRVVRNRRYPKGRRRCKRLQIAPVGFIELTKSRNGGKAWSKPRIVARIGAYPSESGAAIRAIYGLPDAAIDPTTGQLYVSWIQRFAHESYDNVAVSTSHDGGLHWSRRIQVSTAPNERAITPSIAVSTDGTVGTTYYEVLDDGASLTLPTDLCFVSSHDHGSTFGPPVHVGGPFDLNTAPSAGGYFVGDYEGLTAGESFYPFFVATNFGDTANRTDVFSTVVTPSTARSSNPCT
ncbi:MAG: sialidase family protein [Chloroflexota bacterium]